MIWDKECRTEKNSGPSGDPGFGHVLNVFSDKMAIYGFFNKTF